MPFPRNFFWATAASHYQIEGGGLDNGRGWSTWDEIRAEKGRIRDGSELHEHIGGYEKWKEDIKLIKETGVNYYRFSICWSRILPNGTNDLINQEGIAYYRNLLQALRDENITPMVTLFHFDWPLVLFDQGGWRNAKSQQWFLDFSEICFENFGDLVPIWMTFNEISFHVLSAVCKLEGSPFHCPTRKEPEERDAAIYLSCHNKILAHAKTFRLYEQKYKDKFHGRVGIINGGQDFCVGNDALLNAKGTEFTLGWTLDPIMFGEYPETLKKRLIGENGTVKLPEFTEEEKVILKGSTDFLGINYYLPRLIGPGVGKSLIERMAEYTLLENNFEKISGEKSWCRSYPQGLLEMFRLIRDKYGNIPVIVTENGCADIENAGLEDDNRIKLIHGHIKAIEQALEEGCNVFGYTVWCLMDNFEWDDGFGVRFGMYSVDHRDPEKKRIPKKSVQFYRKLISNAHSQ